MPSISSSPQEEVGQSHLSRFVKSRKYYKYLQRQCSARALKGGKPASSGSQMVLHADWLLKSQVGIHCRDPYQYRESSTLYASADLAIPRWTDPNGEPVPSIARDQRARLDAKRTGETRIAAGHEGRPARTHLRAAAAAAPPRWAGDVAMDIGRWADEIVDGCAQPHAPRRANPQQCRGARCM